MKKVFLSGTILIVLSAACVMAQVAPSNIVPPSPSSAEFEKYLNQKVSIYNGIPEISIPLYEIKVRGLTIPIVLNYHASGIKYNQTSGDVGVGWSISPNYRVSRSIYGRVDENSSMQASYPNVRDDFSSSTSRDQYLAYF